MNANRPEGRDDHWPWLAAYLDRGLGDDAAPLAPSAAAWERTRQAVSCRLAQDRRNQRRRRGAVLAGLAAVAAVAAWLAIPNVAEPPLFPVNPDEVAELPDLAMAAPGDVWIESIHGDTHGLVGFDPLAGETLALAGPGDVFVETIRHEPNGGPAPQVSSGPTDVPMIYAAATRRR